MLSAFILTGALFFNVVFLFWLALAMLTIAFIAMIGGFVSLGLVMHTHDSFIMKRAELKDNRCAVAEDEET